MRASVISVRSVVKNMDLRSLCFFSFKVLIWGAQEFYHRAHRDHRGAPRAQENVLRVKLSGTKQISC